MCVNTFFFIKRHTFQISNSDVSKFDEEFKRCLVFLPCILKISFYARQYKAEIVCQGKHPAVKGSGEVDSQEHTLEGSQERALPRPRELSVYAEEYFPNEHSHGP